MGREVFWNIDRPEWMYVFTLAALLIFFYGVYRRFLFWRRGRRTVPRPGALFRRFPSFLSQVFLQVRILQRPSSGLWHLFLFWGFLILFMGTLLLALDYDVLEKFVGISLLRGTFYRLYSLFLDVFGVLAFVGIGGILICRYFFRTRRIAGWPDDLVLWFFFAVLATGFATESLRIAAQPDSREWYSPAGFVLASFFRGIGPAGLEAGHAFLWWGHLLLSLGMIALIPYTRLFHLFSAPLFLLSGVGDKRGVLAPVFSEPFSLPLERLARFPRHSLLALETCTACGRCEEVCPVALPEDGFSPMRLMHELKGQLRSGKSLDSLEESGSIGGIWECLTCLSCEERCPVGLTVPDHVVEMRRNRMLAFCRFPAEIAPLLRNLETFGDPFGAGRFAREDWIQDEKTRKKLKGGAGLLVWIGCQSAFHDRSRRVAGSFCKLLERLRIDFTLLGRKETCCGDLPRRLGGEYLFRTLALENIRTFEKQGIQRIVTLCPHCFHIFKEEYPPWGGEVLHYTQFLAELKEKGLLPVGNPVDRKVAYHDSCYLGRYHHLYAEPRSVFKGLLKEE